MQEVQFSNTTHADLKKSLDSALGEGRLSTPSRQITGFLLRSDVVAGWPDLLVAGSLKVPTDKPLLRMDRLSKNILMCLFDGELTAIHIHLKPETTHFGVSRKDSTEFAKSLRNSDDNSQAAKPIEIPWRHDGNTRVVNIEKLAERMQTKNSAEFAFQMIEGVEGVQFTL